MDFVITLLPTRTSTALFDVTPPQAARLPTLKTTATAEDQRIRLYIALSLSR
jgi:hypothetical protein